MKRIFKPSLIALFFFSVWCSNSSAQLIVKPGDPHLSYIGRIAKSLDSVAFFWPGSTLKMNFTGDAVDVTMRSTREAGYFYAIIDNDAASAFKFKVDSNRAEINVAHGLAAGSHSLEIYKLSNNTSKNILYGLRIGGKAKLLSPTALPIRKIEFYGNSITAGHGVDVPPGQKESGTAEFYNNYYTYAALTARHFGAQYSFIARGGIGVMVSWFPEIMPEIFDRLDPFDSKSKWDFNKYTPDVVVINLFQNDSWLVKLPEHEQFKARFGKKAPTDEFIVDAYQKFVNSIRNKYPKAFIICALGSMDATAPGSKWPGYIEKAVKNINDPKISSLIFPYKNTGGHPNKKEQRSMADQLISFIDQHVKW
ncbi:GDSL-type esterase/lipase family protein [Mucilaginibacter yixingensis]|nr:SGNH/GDSL hydrolase family protein [Mucilaginibacter yixingensis]